MPHQSRELLNELEKVSTTETQTAVLQLDSERAKTNMSPKLPRRTTPIDRTTPKQPHTHTFLSCAGAFGASNSIVCSRRPSVGLCSSAIAG
jgi:hypothetical protein